MLDEKLFNRAYEVETILSKIPGDFNHGLLFEVDYSLERAKVPKELQEQKKVLQGAYRSIAFYLSIQLEFTKPYLLAMLDPTKSVEDVLRIHKETEGCEMNEQDYKSLVAHKTQGHELNENPSAYKEMQPPKAQNQPSPLQSHQIQTQEPAPEIPDLAPPDTEDDDRHQY